MECFGVMRDEYNSDRAVQYARCYLQDKTMNQTGTAAALQYNFAKREHLENTLPSFRIVGYSRLVPELFGVAADITHEYAALQ